MKTIFLDESGELGFSKKSSRYFIITLLVCDFKEEQKIRRIPKKVRRKVLNKKLKKSSELKGSNSSDRVRKEFLTRVAKTNSEIFAIVLDKHKVYDYLKSEKHKLYNYICNIILNECSLDSKKVDLIVDRSKSKRALRDDFDNYIRFKLKSKINECKINILHESSRNDEGLQVVDFISWALFRKYEFRENYFYNLIKENIVTEKELFPGP